MGSSPDSPGRLSIICSPIGNLDDITLRATRVLEEADLLACEDTRHSLRLLQHCKISRKELISLNDHNEGDKAEFLAKRASEGHHIALLSDAGAPTVSDPGYRLVNACIDAGVPVSVIPGPSAVITALAGSGLPTHAFYFGGFLPVKSGKRQRLLEEAIQRDATSLFFESPHRILKTLKALSELAPEHPVCVARELTKKFETYHRGTALSLLQELEPGPVKGEITLLIQGTSEKERKLALRQERAGKFS